MSEELYQQLAKVLHLMATGRIYAARELLEKLLGVDYKDQA